MSGCLLIRLHGLLMLHCVYSVLEQRSVAGMSMTIAVFFEGLGLAVMLPVSLSLAGGAASVVVQFQ